MSEKIDEGISIVIPVFEKSHLTDAFFRSFIGSHDLSNLLFEIIVIDNGKDKETSDLLGIYKNIIGVDKFTILKNEQNVGVSKSWNQGIKISKHNFICIANNDIEFMLPDTMQEMRKNLQRLKLVYWTSPTTCYEKNPKKIIRRPHHYEQLRYGITVDNYVVGCCFMCPRICFDELGVFDEGFDVRYYEDLDFINRIFESGKKVSMTSTAMVYHAVGSTSRHVVGGEGNRAYYDQKWSGKPQYDILAKQPEKINSIKHFS